MARTENLLDSLETHMVNIGAMTKSMETQIGQLENVLKDHNRGQFPSNIEVNPLEYCKAIELRSGKEFGVNESKFEVEKEEKKVEEVEVNEKEPMELKDEPEEKSMFKPKLPYPQRFNKKVLDEKFAKFLEIFNKLHINIPFADALLQMPNYAKFLKKVMSRKQKLEEFETVNLIEDCSAILQKKLPQKLKDPESFTIPCTTGSSNFNKALCNLVASIKLMPLSILRSLGLGEVKATTIALQVADRSIKYMCGIIEDVLEK
ncbi:uncharacterized protein [Henckelia pumila]|uniref:uncharacterized protein n=1 Tax=Henckelia pumila TaxID=405737 RepID=UPI003C6E737C